jgi:hypothetical protein
VDASLVTALAGMLDSVSGASRQLGKRKREVLNGEPLPSRIARTFPEFVIQTRSLVRTIGPADEMFNVWQLRILSKPDVVVEVICAAASAVQKSRGA